MYLPLLHPSCLIARPPHTAHTGNLKLPRREEHSHYSLEASVFGNKESGNSLEATYANEINNTARGRKNRRTAAEGQNGDAVSACPVPGTSPICYSRRQTFKL